MMIEDMLLEKEQNDLLAMLVEASRNVRGEDRRKFFFVETWGESSIQHPGFPNRKVDAYKGDIEELSRKGLLSVDYDKDVLFFDVTPEGFRYYEEMKKRSGEPLQRVERSVIEFLGSEGFQKRYPAAYQKWSQAEGMLWVADSDTQLTTIGHLCREALQEFASALAAQYQIPIDEKDKARTVTILKKVIDLRKDQLGKTEGEFLEALVAYWGTLNDLVQREEHGGQKEGEPLIWEDGRRVVFQTAVVMFETDRSLSRCA